MRLDISVDPGASGSVATQAAEKLYRVNPGEADIAIETNIVVGAGGKCEWLAQEAIAFDRTRFRRRLSARLEGDARLLAVESLVLGRLAMGERFSTGLAHDEWRIRRDGRLVWADALHLDAAALAGHEQRFRFGETKALATMIYAGPDAEAHVPLMRDLLRESGGATCLDALLIVRLHDADPARLKADLIRIGMALRGAGFGYDGPMPAVWSC